MDWLWITIGVICIIAGLAGSLLPVLPGPPLAYVGLLIQLFRDPAPFTARFLWIWAGIVLLTVILDFLIPVWGTRTFGGTKYGVWGCTIGFFMAFWLGPVGVIAGPFLGAMVGELVGGQPPAKAVRAAWGSFIGFLLGSGLKLVCCGVMLVYLLRSA